MSDIREKFYERLKTRNENQLRAIKTISGPVMVIAGPGTGADADDGEQNQ